MSIVNKKRGIKKFPKLWTQFSFKPFYGFTPEERTWLAKYTDIDAIASMGYPAPFENKEMGFDARFSEDGKTIVLYAMGQGDFVQVGRLIQLFLQTFNKKFSVGFTWGMSSPEPEPYGDCGVFSGGYVMVSQDEIFHLSIGELLYEHEAKEDAKRPRKYKV
jgi:hypothetical protein